jgi:hypothetical protein
MKYPLFARNIAGFLVSITIHFLPDTEHCFTTTNGQDKGVTLLQCLIFLRSRKYLLP